MTIMGKKSISLSLKEDAPITATSPPQNSRFSIAVPRKPEWKNYKPSQEVKLWQAILIAHNINPDSLNYGSFYKFQDQVILERLGLLIGNIFKREYFSPSKSNKAVDMNLLPVRLDEFASWCLHMGWDDMPHELAAFAKDKPQAESVMQHARGAKVEVMQTPPIDTSNLVYWRTVLYARIKVIDSNGKATVRKVIKYLRSLNDERIPNKGGTDELIWIDDNENEQKVMKKTVSTAISTARKLP